MQLVINTRGSYLHKQGDCFRVKNDDRVFEVSARKVESITITTAAYLSTDAIKFAMDNNIDLVFLDEHGNPYGRVWHSKLGSTVLIRRRQLEMTTNETGLKLAKQWIVTKFDNQIHHLADLRNTRPKARENLERAIQSLEELRDSVKEVRGKLDECKGAIMGIEGIAGRVYFDAINYVMPERFKFAGRSRNPAKDEFNCLLNYGYGVLYSLVEKACIIAGLDPYIGFVHSDNYNKKSLVFDLIEMYREFADRVVVSLFSSRKVKQSYFDQIQNGMTLNQDGKALLIENLNKFLEKSVRYRGRNIKNRNIIQFECHRLANSLIKE